MALIEAVFKRDADNRTMSFQNIAEETRLPLDEVEHLVMKALRYFPPTSCVIFLTLMSFFLSRSLKLIRGSLDEVDQKAQITWVQPRVLSREQIGQLSGRLSAWVDKLNAVEQRIAPEVFVSA
jgi:26S proteasome regulatory subunit N9